MADFAVVAEGLTDQHVLESIIIGACSDWADEPLVVFEQPPNDATMSHGQPPPGGWTLVRQYLEQRKYLDALQLNRYLVIQIDTDIAGEMGIATHDRGDEEVVESVVAKLRDWIDPNVLEEVGERFVFAVCVDSVECWLLPLLADRSQTMTRRKRTGCLAKANELLRKANRAPLSSGRDAHKHPDHYREVSRPYRKRKLLDASKTDNPGLLRFVNAVEALDV